MKINYICPNASYCKQKYSHFQRLEYHVRQCRRRYICKLCSREYTHKRNLARHSKINPSCQRRIIGNSTHEMSTQCDFHDNLTQAMTQLIENLPRSTTPSSHSQDTENEQTSTNSGETIVPNDLITMPTINQTQEQEPPNINQLQYQPIQFNELQPVEPNFNLMHEFSQLNHINPFDQFNQSNQDLHLDPNNVPGNTNPNQYNHQYNINDQYYGHFNYNSNNSYQSENISDQTLNFFN